MSTRATIEIIHPLNMGDVDHPEKMCKRIANITISVPCYSAELVLLLSGTFQKVFAEIGKTIDRCAVVELQEPLGRFITRGEGP